MVKNRKDLTPRRRSYGQRSVQIRSASTKANIRVVVRIRPHTKAEDNHYMSSTVQVLNEQSLIFDPKDESTPFFYHGVQQKGRDLLKRPHKNLTFNFDRVFSEDSHNMEVFEYSTKELINCLMDGSNCSVFVYGATGAGKTFTMIGKPDMPGITILTMNELFQQKTNLELERDFDLAVSYLEVYNENVKDLLKPGAPLHLREDGKLGVLVAGLMVKRIDNPNELFDLLDKGNKCRTQHPTEANAESSRSHAVFQVYISMKCKKTGQSRFAKLSMIDLAGSERGSVTGCKGARFEEGANINRSLLSLGNCINSLADGKKHIPYRDSKLTRLLKDSLGGNCHTVMIANVSPSPSSLEDTYNTLKYALRAKKIKTNVKKNVINCEMSSSQYLKIIEDLKKENELLKGNYECLKKENELSKGNYNCLKCKTLQKENVRVETITSASMLGMVTSTTVPDAVSSASTSETITSASAPETITSATVPEMVPEENMVNQVKELFEEYKGAQERLHKLKLNKNLISARIHIKEETNNRLSGFCVEDSDKEKGHKKLEQTVSRLQKQASTYESDMQVLEDKLKTLQADIDNLAKLVPSLKDIVGKQYIIFEKVKAEYEVEEYKVILKFWENELQVRGCIMEKMANKMKPWFSLLHSRGLTTDEMVQEYRNIFNDIQGVCKVTFENENSLLSYSSPKTQTPGEVYRLAPKRKLSDLDRTYELIKSPSENLKSHSGRVLTKVYPSPAKRTVKSVALDRLKKENKPLSSRQIGTMGTSTRFILKKGVGDTQVPNFKHTYLKRNHTTTKPNHVKFI